jgi:hypothetical protein
MADKRATKAQKIAGGKLLEAAGDCGIGSIKEEMAALQQQLREARKEINRLREKLGWVPAVFDTKALHREGK